MTDLRNYFSLTLDPAKRDWVLHFLPANITTLSQRQQEQLIATFVRRHIFNGGPDDPDGTATGDNLNIGLDVLNWWEDWADLNQGLGPRTACGTMVRAYGALMAALGHYTRLIGAVGPHGADNQAEYWDTAQQSWTFRNLGCGILYRHRDTGTLLSYLSMSQLARNGDGDLLVASSPNNQEALAPAGDRYAPWHLWTNDAAISNGNAVFIAQPHEWRMMRVWPPAAGKQSVWDPAWTVEQPPKHLLYPDPTTATTNP